MYSFKQIEVDFNQQITIGDCNIDDDSTDKVEHDIDKQSKRMGLDLADVLRRGEDIDIDMTRSELIEKYMIMTQQEL